MGEPFSGAPPSEKPLGGRLDSWKEIAGHLNRDVTTVQRWEKREGMPVHRHLHDRMGSVYAYRAELETWARSRNLRTVQQKGNDVPSPGSSTSLSPITAAASKLISSWKLGTTLAAVGVLLTLGAILWLRTTEYFWKNPIANARFQSVTDFDGVARAAAVSRDGHLIAFLSDRDGQMDVWITQAGSGQFHDLTHGSMPELINPSIRTLGFSPDGSLVTFWVRRQNGAGGGDIGIWSVPTLGGQPRPYLDGAAEFDWSRDGSRLTYHTPGPGDPLFVSEGDMKPGALPIFTAPTGLHSHFPLWSHDGSFIYFVQGSLPDKLDIWRVRSSGGTSERITSHDTRVTYPVFLNQRTLAYLATDPDGSGPWLYSMDVDHRIPHRLTLGPDRYTSLAATADGERLVATIATPKTTLWRLPIASSATTAFAPTDSAREASAPAPISLTSGTGFSPRLGPNYLLYVSATGTTQSIWKLAGGASTGLTSTELWSGEGAQIFGGPAISPDGQSIAFSIQQQNGKTLLYAMQADGSNARIVTESLNLQGDPAWSPDGQSITSAADDHGVPRLFRIPLDGRPATVFVQEYSLDPAWTPDGRMMVYSGSDVGTTFLVKAVTADATTHPMPALTLTRGARHLAFLRGSHALVYLRGEVQHKDLWLLDLETGAERQLTNLAPDFNIRNFDVSPDGREVILERVQERSDVVLLDLPRP